MPVCAIPAAALVINAGEPAEVLRKSLRSIIVLIVRPKNPIVLKTQLQATGSARARSGAAKDRRPWLQRIPSLDLGS